MSQSMRQLIEEVLCLFKALLKSEAHLFLDPDLQVYWYFVLFIQSIEDVIFLF